ncbi:UbiD family decarboxylase [Mycobacteroides immunogenum]|uniref:Pyrrole-2-carboxylic acid decarboxylase n=1 Tax=Mycobacteroides immunogenum TaxID=83262 RepID=A0A7V8RYB4_9MYCO|nr:UbiD family decarboxylase [Mycobacteroides immunogenum]AMT71215.1 4'-phosphopantetheinyl transferase [Mycobacteroides immunogenum]ANO04324.1 4'-phosphopantetheinyl transferase [Mycobacteroides immunogenum]KIU37577.1 4'-phosphopantetheinyl transferase [Mycobacteroides immunogenum]KPG14820.1 4'-phosphopantetheinyl transferase [Mycobacteroides immunogenum]KPG15436.1 4'-phosphopantetheinyl transferase [Mycobacteroides immunogenum]
MVQHGSALNFRDFVDELVRVGDAVMIDASVDAHLEAAAVARRVYESGGPAPVFNHVNGAAPGYRLMGAPAGMSALGSGYGRIAAHFGLPRASGARDIVEQLVAAMAAEPIEPAIVDTGPAKEHIMVGDEVDLERFGVPLLHRQDGGRYFGTYGMHIVRTPDGSWTSWSISRLMLRDKRSLVGPAMAQQHLGMIHRQWAALGKPTPWAFVLGAPPAAIAAAGMPLPDGINEDGYVGALTGRGVEVTRAQLHDLMVPANAEIVVEGYIDPVETDLEGPMGEYHGYQFEDSKPQPIFRVEAITHRDRPILPFCVAGMPPEENHTIWGTMIAASALDLLRRANFPVDFAWCSYEAATCWIVVSVDLDALRRQPVGEAELVRRIADILFTSHVGWLVPKVLLVANDIDITDINQLVWAMATRYRPGMGEYVFRDAPGIPLVPYLTAEDVRNQRGGKAITSLLQPEQLASGRTHGIAAQFTTSYPEGLQQKVIDRWTEYGFPENSSLANGT